MVDAMQDGRGIIQDGAMRKQSGDVFTFKIISDELEVYAYGELFAELKLISASNRDSSEKINITVVNILGKSVSNAKVYFFQDNNFEAKMTDLSGNASFIQSWKPTAIIAFDPNGYYGIGAIMLDQSSFNYTIRLGESPLNDSEAGIQFDNIVNVIGKLYGYYKTSDFFNKAFKAISLGSNAIGMISYGTPTVFSINPIAIEDGRPIMQISGTMVDEMKKTLCNLRRLQGGYGCYELQSF